MNREWLICGALAVLCHATLLFGFRFGMAPVPLPMDDTAVEVALVTGEPPPAPVEPEPEPPPPSEPAPIPEPMPEPVPAPLPEPTPRPEPATPPSRREPPSPAPRRPGPPTTSVTGPSSSAIAGAAHGNTEARPRSNPKPPYPAEARRLRQEGRVILIVSVTADGRASAVSILRSSGVPTLDQAAVETVRRWTFEPARGAGLAVPSRVEIPVNFGLRD